MFMMPYVSRLTRSSFPFGVILLVILNVLVFFGPQAMDHTRGQRVAEYYAESVLPKTELPAFARYLRDQGKTEAAKRFDAILEQENWFVALNEMEHDAAFMRRLHENQVITPDNPAYDDWHRMRQRYEEMRHTLFTERFQFDTSHPSWLTALSHQFLHGDNGHIFGNMVVLALIAPAVEALIGTGSFLALYLVCGMAAAGSHMLFTQGMPGGLVGASGAISGAMGAFAVLLGRRRIPFFYFIFVYFDVIRAPALLALPLWLANELLQFFWLGGSHVAYGAHFGGLLTGALLAWPLRRRALARLEAEPAAPQEAAQDEQSVARMAGLKEARRLMTAQRFDEARCAYGRLAMLSGVDQPMLRECLNVCKLVPASEEYHRVASRILMTRRIEGSFALETFRDYLQQAKPVPRLSADMLLELVTRFLQLRAHADAERALRLLYKLAPAHPSLPGLTEQTAQAWAEAGEPMAAQSLRSSLPGRA
ncbi:rhomboid family intramembrane serine protease [Uliginosibacterium gangwonense]|uniref:rhomboid family intramembrane serine protease n=1 Tax=Uliginosibacterium gangwonense TaxID=392736 RepID=UPI00036E3BB7|nr:rhomboid family intramembrane serine protease [Uliginosibacterium gangwonense]